MIQAEATAAAVAALPTEKPLDTVFFQADGAAFNDWNKYTAIKMVNSIKKSSHPNLGNLWFRIFSLACLLAKRGKLLLGPLARLKHIIRAARSWFTWTYSSQPRTPYLNWG